MKRLKSIQEFSKKNEVSKINLSAIYGGKMLLDCTLTGCQDSLVCSPPCADCSDKD